ncbi:MAG: hypothetical protein ABSA11_15590 [Candidatus Bathyarchaeia archaeon]|jgi:hypothetical protein
MSYGYGKLQSPIWTRKHSYVTLLSLLFIFLTFFPVSVALANGPPDVAGTYTSYGFPFTWLTVKIGISTTYQITSVSGLLLNLCFNIVISTVIVYPQKVAQLLSKN